MKIGIYLTRVWFDNDVVRLRIESSDGKSLFVNEVYAAYDLNGVVEGLSTFKNHVHGGIYDIMLGAFGPEYGSGDVHYTSPVQELAFRQSVLRKVPARRCITKEEGDKNDSSLCFALARMCVTGA